MENKFDTKIMLDTEIRKNMLNTTKLAQTGMFLFSIDNKIFALFGEFLTKYVF